MKNSTTIFIPLLMLFFINNIIAQSPYFKHHDLAKEYPNLRMELIYEDGQGHMWLGTSEGLFRYNGLDYKQFPRPDTSSSQVTAIMEDYLKTLWIGYDDGAIFQLKNQQLNMFEASSILNTSINGLVEGDLKKVWIATYGQGLFCYVDGQLKGVTTEDGLLGDDIYVISKDKYDRIWIGTDGGINMCQLIDGRFKIQSLTKDDGLPDDIVKEILPDKNGNMWIGMYDNGICSYELDKKKFHYPEGEFRDKIVEELLLYENKELWIGTNGDGLWRYSLDDHLFRPINQHDQPIASKIYDLLKDVEGNAWVLTNDHGLCHTNRQFEFIPQETLSGLKNIQALITDSQNNLWVGTENGLFVSTEEVNKSQDFKPVLADLNVISLYQDKFGNIWAGTFGDGVYIFHSKTTEVKLLKEADGLTNDGVLSINGINDKVWLATLGGVTEIENAVNIFDQKKLNIKNFNKESGLGTNFIYKIFIDSKERVWFATDGKGISVLEDGNITNYNEAKHSHSKKHHHDSNQVLSNDTIIEHLKAVYSITEDHRGHIWFSTDRKGIFEFDGMHFKHLTVKEGIRDLAIMSLITDRKGNIVIVHPSGIDLLDPETHHLIYYDNDVGISELDPNPNAVCKDKFDNIWIAGQNNIIRYTPLYEDLEIHPRTQINSVSVFLEPVDFLNTNEFSPDQNNLVFEYTGIWYTDPETVKYRYQLENYDLNWIYTSDSRATYSNLPPGEYTFKVTSTENDAFSDEPIASYYFKIDAPYWQSWWFILGVFGLIGLIFFTYQRERDRRIQRVNLLEKENVFSQLETIKAQINPHFLFNSFNTLITIIEENPELGVEYVEHLSDYFRSILLYRDKEIIELGEEIKLIQNYDFLLKKRFGDNFNLSIGVNGEPVYVAPLTLQMLVENAVKHNVISQSHPLFVSIDLAENDYIAVKNNLQEKINAPQSTSFGLQSIAKRYELLSDKKILIEKTKDFFIVKIPFIN